MRLEEKHKHLGVASLFSILMHFGAIGGAIVGGLMLEYIDPKGVYLVMAASDALQVVVCLVIIFKLRVSFLQNHDETSSFTTKEAQPPLAPRKKGYVYTLGMISLIFYLSSFLIRPFFSRHWEAVSSMSNELLTAFIYSIPGWVALAGLWFNHVRNKVGNHYTAIFNALVLGLIGVYVQSVEQPVLVILGRCIFGWALFQVTVRLEVALFEQSHKDDYATDFSKIHLFQNVGVLIASLSVGSLVSFMGYRLPFWVSLVGFLVTILLFVGFFKSRMSTKLPSQKETQTV